MPKAPISFDDLARLLILNAPASEDLTLVGGRAVEYWTAFYQVLYPHLFEDIQIVGTRDLDYALVTKESAVVCTERWRRVLKEVGLDIKTQVVPLGDHSPEYAHSSIEVDKNAPDHERWFMIDYLFDLFGINKNQIAKNRVRQEAPWNTHHFVISEYLTLANRTYNVSGIKGRDNAKGISQLKQAIAINKAYLLSILDDAENDLEIRFALKEIARIATLGLDKKLGIHLNLKYGIDLLEAIPHDHSGLPGEFREFRWPQIQSEKEKRMSALNKKRDKGEN